MSKDIFTFQLTDSAETFDNLNKFEKFKYLGQSNNVSVGMYNNGCIAVKSEHENEVYFFGLIPETLENIVLALDDLIQKIKNTQTTEDTKSTEVEP